jgi:hypothetical protein
MKELVRKLIAIQAELNCMKALYKQQDEILDKLIAAGFTSMKTDGYVVTLVDNYSKKNTAFKAVGFRRFEVLITDA